MSVVLFAAPTGVHNTSKDYGAELVSYGTVGEYNFKVNGENLKFLENKLEGTVRIDERNLSLCICLNLRGSSVESLDGAHLKNVEFLEATDS